MQQQILRFQISMHDIMLWQNLEGFDYLSEVRQSLLLWQWSLLFKQFLKGTSIAKLIHEVKIIDSFEHIEVLDDMLAWFKVSKDVDLVIGALFKFGVLLEFLCFDHLDSHLLLVLHVNSTIDCGVHAATDLVLQRVVFNHLTHLELNIYLSLTPILNN